MTYETLPPPDRPATEPVAPGAVIAATLPRQSGAFWARVGLLGIGVAALIAAAAMAFAATASPTGTLAAGSGDATTPGDVRGLHGGRGVGGRGHGGFGAITITGISGSSIGLETEDGWTRTIVVDDGTTYTEAGEAIALTDLEVGDTIGFRQTLEDDGTWTIDAIVVVLPHLGGEVTAVGGSTITVERRDGTTATINVDGDTTFIVNGDAATLDSIEVGMVLVAEGPAAGDGAIDAVRVRAADQSRFRGPGRDGPRFFDGGRGPGPTTAPEGTDSAS